MWVQPAFCLFRLGILWHDMNHLLKLQLFGLVITGDGDGRSSGGDLMVLLFFVCAVFDHMCWSYGMS